MKRKDIMSEIEELMTKYRGKSDKSKKKNLEWYYDGKVDGLNIAWKLLNGSYIKEEYE